MFYENTRTSNCFSTHRLYRRCVCKPTV